MRISDWSSDVCSSDLDYKTNVEKYGPLGAASFSFDEAFNVMAQGKAYSYITYNFFRTAYDDPSQSAVVGKVELMGVPGQKEGEGASLNEIGRASCRERVCQYV